MNVLIFQLYFIRHTDHFRCVDSGAPLDGEYFTVEGLPYSLDSFFALFGKKCSTCQEVLILFFFKC